MLRIDRVAAAHRVQKMDRLRVPVWPNLNPSRVTSMAVVLAVHAAAFMYATLPASPFHPHVRSASQPSAITRVRLIDQRVVMSVASSPRLRSWTKPKHITNVPQSPASVALPDRVWTAPLARREKKRLDLSAPGKAGASWNGRDQVVRVGRAIEQRQPTHKPRLPGVAHIPGAPHLRMIDPRSQGVGGLVRKVSSLFGAVNSHCVQVDAWRAMNPAELARDHLTEAGVENTADEYGCVRPQRHAGVPPGAGFGN